MKNFMRIMACMVALMMVVSSSAFAAGSVAFSVRVTIASEADITVTQGGPINLGTQDAGSTAASGSAIIIQNTGSGGSQTYSLSLTDPANLTAVTAAPGVDEYRLSAIFNSVSTGITWNPTNMALTTTVVASSGTKFAGDQSGTGVAYNALRNIYIQFEAPSATTATALQDISVTISAQVD